MIESNSIFFFLVQRQDGTERDPCIPFGVADAIMLDGPHEAVVIDRSTRFTSRGFTKHDEGIDVIKRSFTVRGCRTQGGKERVKDLIGGHANASRKGKNGSFFLPIPEFFSEEQYYFD